MFLSLKVCLRENSPFTVSIYPKTFEKYEGDINNFNSFKRAKRKLEVKQALGRMFSTPWQMRDARTLHDTLRIH